MTDWQYQQSVKNILGGDDGGGTHSEALKVANATVERQSAELKEQHAKIMALRAENADLRAQLLRRG